MHNDERERSEPEGGADEARDAAPDDSAAPASDQPPSAPLDEPSAPDVPSAEEWPSRDLPAEPAATEPAPAEPAVAADEAAPAEPPPADWPAEPPPAEWPSAEAAPGQEEMEAPAPVGHELPPSEVEAHPSESPPEPPPAGTAVPAAHVVPDSGGTLGESTLCPRCGTENRPGLAFCRNCGQRLLAAGVAPTIERPTAPEGSQACPRCGTHNRAGVAFCQNCGANLRTAAPGYVPPAIAAPAESVVTTEARGGALLGPVVLLIGVVGIVTAYLLPFAYGAGSLFERSFGSGGYGAAFWNGYPDVAGTLADQAYFGLAAPAPLAALLLVLLAVAGFVRAAPGRLQGIGLVIALLWAIGIGIGFVVVELVGNLGDDLVGVLGSLNAAGIIFFLAALIVIIGTLTRLARS